LLLYEPYWSVILATVTSCVRCLVRLLLKKRKRRLMQLVWVLSQLLSIRLYCSLQ